jgi:hypothetical protein
MDDGRPAEVWFLVVECWADDSYGWVIERMFRGPYGLGEAQAYQRERGGYIVSALDWVRDGSDDGVM